MFIGTTLESEGTMAVLLASKPLTTPETLREHVVPPPDTTPIVRTANYNATESSAAQIFRLSFTALVLFLLSFGWMFSMREEFTPKDGVGYWLGIVGGSSLLILAAYPLRKRARFMARLGSAPSWFRFHMILGILGPILILYHSNFSTGATNSNVALFAMLTVSGSGIAGRYFYGKIHNGLYGARSTLQDILQEATSLLTVIESDVGGTGGSIAGQLTAFATRALNHRTSIMANLGSAIWLTFATHFVRPRIMAAVKEAIEKNAKTQRWSAAQKRSHYRAARLHVAGYFAAVTKASQLSFYERLFSLWHILHVPLYFLLILTGITHVVAVHLY
jgi:hypothetical protein